MGGAARSFSSSGSEEGSGRVSRLGSDIPDGVELDDDCPPDALLDELRDDDEPELLPVEPPLADDGEPAAEASARLTGSPPVPPVEGIPVEGRFGGEIPALARA